MSAHRHPNWLKEARRAEGGGVSEDDKQRSQHLQDMRKAASQYGPSFDENRHPVIEQAVKNYDTPLPGHSNYEDMINRANESGADPADVQDVLQGAMDRNKGD